MNGNEKSCNVSEPSFFKEEYKSQHAQRQDRAGDREERNGRECQDFPVAEDRHPRLPTRLLQHAGVVNVAVLRRRSACRTGPLPPGTSPPTQHESFEKRLSHSSHTRVNVQLRK